MYLAFLGAEFQPQARICKSTRYPVAILIGHALGPGDVVPSAQHGAFHVVDHRLGFSTIEQKPRGLGQQVVGMCTHVAANEGEVTPFDADGLCGEYRDAMLRTLALP